MVNTSHSQLILAPKPALGKSKPAVDKPKFRQGLPKILLGLYRAIKNHSYLTSVSTVWAACAG